MFKLNIIVWKLWCSGSWPPTADEWLKGIFKLPCRARNLPHSLAAAQTSAGTLPPWRGQPFAGRSGWARWAWRWSCRAAPGTCAAWWARRWTGCGSPPPHPWGWPRTPLAWRQTAPTAGPCPLATAAGRRRRLVGARTLGVQGRTGSRRPSAQPGTEATVGSCIHHSGTGIPVSGAWDSHVHHHPGDAAATGARRRPSSAPASSGPGPRWRWPLESKYPFQYELSSKST